MRVLVKLNVSSSLDTAEGVTGSFTGSFSGDGGNLLNITASNINNFTSDSRKQISGTGVISYDPITGIISYTGAGGTIYTDGNITGSGTALDPIRTKNAITASSGVSASYFYGDGSNLTGLMQSVYTGGNITGSGTSTDKIGIIPNPIFNNVTASSYTGSFAKLDYIDMTPSSPAFNIGRLHYDTAAEVLKFDLPYENTQLNIGKQLIAKVKNVTGQTIGKGKVVYVDGSQGASELLYITTSSWDSDPTSAYTFGFTMSEFADNDIGYVILEGILEGINTLGYSPGALLYLSSSGDFTTTKPVQPKHAVRLGHIARVQNPNGSIFVRIQNGYEMDELHDVLITSPQNYDFLVLDTDGLWKNTKTLNGNYTFSGNNKFTGSLSGTSSYANNAGTLNGNSDTVFAKLESINTFTATSNIFDHDVIINGTASIGFLNNVNQQSLNIGDKYITILSGSNTHVQMDGAGILFGSGSTDETTGDQNSIAHIVYRKGNAPTDFTSDYIEVYPQLRSIGVISGSNLTGSNTGDETQTTIKTKLGAASTSTDGYLTSTDWTTFNNKQNTVYVGGNITGSGTAGSPYGVNTNPTFTNLTASAISSSNIQAGRFTGSFVGDGSELANVPSSLVFGGNITGSGTAGSPYGVNANPTFTTITASTGINGAAVAATSLSASSTLQAGGQSTFGGGIKVPYSAKTSNYGLTASIDYIISFNGLNLTASLPNAANNLGTVFVIKNLATSSVFVTSSVSNIDGNTAGIIIYGQYTSYTFISDNINWLIV